RGTSASPRPPIEWATPTAGSRSKSEWSETPSRSHRTASSSASTRRNTIRTRPTEPSPTPAGNQTGSTPRRKPAAQCRGGTGAKVSCGYRDLTASGRSLELTDVGYISGSPERARRTMTEREQQRLVNHRLAVIRHAEEVTGNVAQTCRYFGITRQTFYRWLRRYEE